jgi:hypothetical protein
MIFYFSQIISGKKPAPIRYASMDYVCENLKILVTQITEDGERETTAVCIRGCFSKNHIQTGKFLCKNLVVLLSHSIVLLSKLLTDSGIDD